MVYYRSNFNVGIKCGGDDDWGSMVALQASRSWTGETSENGFHSHQININQSGEHSHTAFVQQTGSGESIDIRPRFYKSAFFLKLPN